MDIDEFDHLSANLKHYLENTIGLFSLRDILLCVVNILLTIHTFMFVDFRAHRHAHAISPAWIQAPVHFSKGCLAMG